VHELTVLRRKRQQNWGKTRLGGARRTQVRICDGRKPANQRKRPNDPVSLSRWLRLRVSSVPSSSLTT